YPVECAVAAHRQSSSRKLAFYVPIHVPGAVVAGSVERGEVPRAIYSEELAAGRPVVCAVASLDERRQGIDGGSDEGSGLKRMEHGEVPGAVDPVETVRRGSV